jgi:ABC-type sugar transport system ATPase subunit
VAFFVGEPSMNFVNGRFENGASVCIPTPQGKRVFRFKGDPDGKYAGAEITIGVRPQQIKVSHENREENAIPGKVRIIEFQGETTVLTIDLDDNVQSEAKAVVAATERYAVGETVWLYFSPEIIHLFDGDLPVLCRDI